MDTTEFVFAKFQGENGRTNFIGVASHSYLKYIPWLLGSAKKSVIKASDTSYSVNIPIDQVELSDSDLKLEVIREQIAHKLVIDKCRSISSVHAIIRFWTETPEDSIEADVDQQEGFYIKAISPLYLNNELITQKSGYHK